MSLPPLGASNLSLYKQILIFIPMVGLDGGNYFKYFPSFFLPISTASVSPFFPPTALPKPPISNKKQIQLSAVLLHLKTGLHKQSAWITLQSLKPDHCPESVLIST